MTLASLSFDEFLHWLSTAAPPSFALTDPCRCPVAAFVCHKVGITPDDERVVVAHPEDGMRPRLTIDDQAFYLPEWCGWYVNGFDDLLKGRPTKAVARLECVLIAQSLAVEEPWAAVGQ